MGLHIDLIVLGINGLQEKKILFLFFPEICSTKTMLCGLSAYYQI